MWDRWFRQWLNAFFWWLPRKDRDEESPPRQEGRSEQEERRPPAAEAREEPAGQEEQPRPAAEVAPEPATSPQAGPDDLTVIKGLGPAMQRKLEAAGISSFKQLAEADAQALTDELKPSQRTITREKVEEWIEEARKRQDS